MACGKPILASTKVGSAISLIKNNENGRIFEADNLEDLKRNLEFLAHSPELSQMGNKSKEIIKNWSFSAIKKSLEENCFKQA